MFEDTTDTVHYFDSISAEIVKAEIEQAIEERTSPLIFLLGDPGVGKSYMLKYISAKTDEQHLSIFIDYPFYDNQELLKILCEAKGLEYDNHISFSHLQKELLNAYKESKHTIFIDEAQLLNEVQLEFIRVLSDTKVFQFLLSMHKEEGKILLEKKHFKSRTKVIINYNTLHSSEVSRYIQNSLLLRNYSDISFMFTQSNAKKITKYCDGNFRTIKKFVHTLLSLLEYAQENHLRKYSNINNCLLQMSALEIGVSHDS